MNICYASVLSSLSRSEHACSTYIFVFLSCPYAICFYNQFHLASFLKNLILLVKLKILTLYFKYMLQIILCRQNYHLFCLCTEDYIDQTDLCPQILWNNFVFELIHRCFCLQKEMFSRILFLFANIRGWPWPKPSFLHRHECSYLFWNCTMN